jgi:uncharacterized membrane-anchored protein
MEFLILLIILHFIVNLVIAARFLLQEQASNSFTPAWWDYLAFYGVLLLFGWLVLLTFKAFDPYD